jgi:peptidoglycan-N-acetylglucosamine deacetylase
MATAAAPATHDAPAPAPTLRARIKTAMFDRVPGLVRRGPTATKRVALTFDDGPDELTPKYLDLLDELGVPATFFLVGASADRHPELVREYVRRGHQVAGHGYDHTRFSRLPRRALLDQVRQTDAAIGGSPTGHPWVRPPHGDLDALSIVTLRAAGFVVALWSVDSCDYAHRDADAVVDLCSPAHVTAGDVLLFHEGQEWTLEALPRIVAGMHASGLECVTMHDLFAK